MSEAWSHLLSTHGGVKVKLTAERWQVYVRKGEDEWRFAASGGLGDGAVAGEPHRIGELRIDAKTRQVFLDQNAVRLAPREFDLLYVLSEDPTRVFTKDELQTVWGYRANTRTLDSHASRLRKKLDGRYVDNIWGVGYRLLRENP